MLAHESNHGEDRGTLERVVGVIRMVVIVCWTVLWILLALVAMLGSFRRSMALTLARRAWGPGVLWLAGMTLEIDPLPDIPWDRPHVYVMNHQSMMDIPVAFTALRSDLHFVAKHSLKYVPFLGWYMWATGMIFVQRTQRHQSIETMAKAARQIREGASIIVYPEGTRSKDGELKTFKRGAFALALQAQVPVVPVAIAGTRQVLRSGSFSASPGRVRVKVGEPIPTTGRGVDERAALGTEAERRVRALYEALRARP